MLEVELQMFLSFCLFFNFFLSLEIRLNSVEQSKQSVDQKRPLAPAAAWRPEAIASLRLSYSYATVPENL